MFGSAVNAAWTFGWILVAMSAIVTSVNDSLQPEQYFENCDLTPVTIGTVDLTWLIVTTSASVLPPVPTIAWSAISSPASSYGMLTTPPTFGADFWWMSYRCATIVGMPFAFAALICGCSAAGSFPASSTIALAFCAIAAFIP